MVLILILDTGQIRVKASSAINRLTTKVNNVILVGDELGKTTRQIYVQHTIGSKTSLHATARKPEFFEAVMRYIYYAGACEEILQFTPHFLFP